MMNFRHPTDVEKQTLRMMADQIGAVEMIRTIGQIIAHDHFDMQAGTAIRSQLMKIAGELNEDKGPGI